ncbi:AGE family epimerase/isomerase [Pelagicoccus sp. SDUM812005]|uniref:AGE family epimerase/isomerase n=1 Tax=Pelagicoccus sp. SDUM812005 TaxID=3041257 RepID=UPI00280EA397|nr:AGE family epimerase/isomerase [Pelagicoccus sp. SDUM812005]MDQ8179076.1 AGE family epimerase/isomerase [Pelagicoccus sp. SDUM812005]
MRFFILGFGFLRWLLGVSFAAADEAILAELEASFERDLIEAWYPRAVDREMGGYVTGFDFKWEPTEETDKFLVGQARHVWVLSQLAGYKGDASFAEQARHGVRFLIDVMWDAENGGFFEGVSQAGEPILEEGKSAYGMSFSIYALAAFYRETKDAEALAYAKRAFEWLDRHARDEQEGGYVDDLDLRGKWSRKRIYDSDTIAIGAKDYNSSIHLLECFTALYAVWPDDCLRTRLEQMLAILRDRFVQEPAYLHLIFDREWRKLSFRDEGRESVMRHRFVDHVSWGHDVETAFLMLEAAELLYGEPGERTSEVAKALVDHALATGWDAERGSLFEGGYYFGDCGEVEVIMPQKVWWIAAESLNATLLMSQLYPGEPKYRQAFEDQWAYIKRYLIDAEHGGWLATGRDSDPAAGSQAKASRWKASYHDGRAYLNCIEMLRESFPLTRH